MQEQEWLKRKEKIYPVTEKSSSKNFTNLQNFTRYTERLNFSINKKLIFITSLEQSLKLMPPVHTISPLSVLSSLQKMIVYNIFFFFRSKFRLEERDSRHQYLSFYLYAYLSGYLSSWCMSINCLIFKLKSSLLLKCFAKFPPRG